MRKAACVVGSRGGIGSAVVERFRANGWDPVIGMDIDGDIAIDVSDPRSVEAAFRQARTLAPQLHTFVHAAGILDLGSLASTELDQWNRTLAINLTGPFLCCKEASSWLSDHGRIVLIGSLAGRTGGVLTGTAYAASKGGVESLTKSIAQHLAPRGITVNCVAPGGVDTTMLARNPEKSRAAMTAATPLRRIATPQEVAGVIAFLASEDAAFITGATVAVNGGLRMD